MRQPASHPSKRQINFSLSLSLSLSLPLSTMSSNLKLSYQRLRRFLPTENDYEKNLEEAEEPKEELLLQTSWIRLGSNRRQRQRQRWRWRRSPRVRVAGLRRLLRRKVELLKTGVAKVLKRLKEGKPYMAELFAGNYMFMQVSPSPSLSHLHKSYPFLPRGYLPYKHGLTVSQQTLQGYDGYPKGSFLANFSG